MIQSMKGHYVFDPSSIQLFASRQQGVFYLGYVNHLKEFVPLYIGVAEGGHTSIKACVTAFLESHPWSDDMQKRITHFAFRACSTSSEAKALEKYELEKFHPQYNDSVEGEAVFLPIKSFRFEAKRVA